MSLLSGLCGQDRHTSCLPAFGIADVFGPVNSGIDHHVGNHNSSTVLATARVAFLPDPVAWLAVLMGALREFK